MALDTIMDGSQGLPSVLNFGKVNSKACIFSEYSDPFHLASQIKAVVACIWKLDLPFSTF